MTVASGKVTPADVGAHLARENGHHASAPAGANETHAPMLVRLDQVPAESVTWLWPGRIALGKLTLIVGNPGEGKTFVSLDIAARNTSGRLWPDGAPATRGAVIVLTGEDGMADTVRPRIDLQRGDPSRVSVLRGVRVNADERPFTLERDLPVLEWAITDTGANLVSIDPLSAYLGNKDSYKDAEIRGILSPLAALAERCRVAILGIMHLTKNAQRQLLLRAQGSVAFVAAARTVFAIGEIPMHQAAACSCR